MTKKGKVNYGRIEIEYEIDDKNVLWVKYETKLIGLDEIKPINDAEDLEVKVVEIFKKMYKTNKPDLGLN